ncbi:MAG: hypothetical protein PGN24_04605 [Microbacterium arborescens]
MHIAGLDDDLIDAFRSVVEDGHRPDALVVPVAIPPGDSELPATLHQIEALLERELSRLSPRVLIVAVVADGDAARARAIAAEIVDGASVYSSNSLGRDLTAIGVVVDDQAHRDVVVGRVCDHLRGGSNLGDGTVVIAKDLRRSSLRDLILEDVL